MHKPSTTIGVSGRCDSPDCGSSRFYLCLEFSRVGSLLCGKPIDPVAKDPTKQRQNMNIWTFVRSLKNYRVPGNLYITVIIFF